MSPAATLAVDAARRQYLDLLQRVLTREISPELFRPLLPSRRPVRQRVARALVRWLLGRKTTVAESVRFDPQARLEGRDWPADAETMVGSLRLAQLRQAVETVVAERIPGDLIETGVWRGGSCILMKAVLSALGDQERTVWLADSFQGLPKPEPEKFPADAEDRHWMWDDLRISEETVRGNFARYDLLDERVRFLVGWFQDTLPRAPIERLAILRLDGDMYSSTMDAITALYPRLSQGGYCIVDDHGAVPACAQAIADYRAAHGIRDPLEKIDWTGVFWRKS